MTPTQAQIDILRNELMALCDVLLRENNLTRSTFKIEVFKIHERLNALKNRS